MKEAEAAMKLGKVRTAYSLYGRSIREHHADMNPVFVVVAYENKARAAEGFDDWKRALQVCVGVCCCVLLMIYVGL